MSFYKQQSSKTEVLEVLSITSAELTRCCSAPVEKDGRYLGGKRCDLRVSWDTLGETALLSWSASSRGDIASPGTKEPVDAIILSLPLNIGVEIPAECS